MHPLCNRQPLARLSTPFSQPRRRRWRWRHEDDDDTITDEIYVEVDDVSHSANSWKDRQGSRHGFFFCLPAITMLLLKTTATTPRCARYDCYARGFVERCNVVNDFRCNFAHSFFSLSVCRLLHAICQHTRILSILSIISCEKKLGHLQIRIFYLHFWSWLLIINSLILFVLFISNIILRYYLLQS